MLPPSLLALAAALAATVDAKPLGRRAARALGADARLERRAGSAISQVSQADWDTLNKAVGGRLNKGVPLGRSCYLDAQTNAGTNGAYSPTQCTYDSNNYKNDIYIASNFGGYMQTNWATCQATGAQCQLSYSAPSPASPVGHTCSQGSVSPYYVDARQPGDISAALQFASAHSLPVVVKASGHDYKGRSSGVDSLGIWTHNIRAGPTMRRGFVAAGCSASSAKDAVTFGAGTDFITLYKFADANQVTVIGGSSETVVAGGGWLSAAGHSSISNLYGLGADRAVEISAVLPNGTFVTASRCQNPTLFKALRGGGGGVFGVHWNVTMTVEPKLTLQGAYVRFASVNQTAAANFLKLCIKNADQWAKNGWGGYIEPAALTKQLSGFVLVTPKLNTAQAKASMQEIFDFVAASNLTSYGNVALNAEITQFDGFLPFYNKYLVPNEEVVGIGTAIASRFLMRGNFVGRTSADTVQIQGKTFDAMMNAMNTIGTNVLQKSAGLGLLPYGGAPFQILVTAPTSYPGGYDGTSSVNPNWYNTYWHVILGPTFDYTASVSDVEGVFKKVSSAADYLRAIAPTSGVYQNEADTFEPNHETSFWGQDNFNFLSAYKKQIDPTNLLTCHQCIGWNPSDPRWSCYPAPPTGSVS